MFSHPSVHCHKILTSPNVSGLALHQWKVTEKLMFVVYVILHDFRISLIYTFKMIILIC